MDAVDQMMEQWRAEMPQVATPALEVVKRLGRLNAIIDEAISEVLSGYELTYAEFDVLMTLRRSGAPYRLKPSQLTRATMLSSGGTSNIKRRLTAAGLTEASDDPIDGRSSWLSLSPKGVQIAEETATAVGAALDRIFEDLPRDSITMLNECLRLQSSGN